MILSKLISKMEKPNRKLLLSIKSKIKRRKLNFILSKLVSKIKKPNRKLLISMKIKMKRRN